MFTPKTLNTNKLGSKKLSQKCKYSAYRQNKMKEKKCYGKEGSNNAINLNHASNVNEGHEMMVLR
jgi:hypothetical protein